VGAALIGEQLPGYAADAYCVSSSLPGSTGNEYASGYPASPLDAVGYKGADYHSVHVLASVRASDGAKQYHHAYMLYKQNWRAAS